MKINISSKRNIILSILLLVAIAFSIITIVRATTPNPGHSFTEIDVNQVKKTSSATLLTTETVVLADASAGAITLTLPPAANVTPRTIYFIKKIDSSLANLVTIVGNASETIDGSHSITLAQRGEGVVLQTDGTNWQVLQRTVYDISAYRAKGSTLNEWYTSPITGTALTTGAPSYNNLRVTPFIVSKTTTIDSMAIDVTSAGSGGTTSARVGIYADNGNDYPGALIVDAGAVSTMGSTGIKTFTTNLPVILQPGLYWLAYVNDCASTAPTIRAFAVASLIPVLGFASTLPTNAQFGWSVTFTYAALPATFPTGGAAITAVPIPAVFVRTSL